MDRRIVGLAVLLAAAAFTASAPAADAATLAVDDDHVDCPTAAFTSVQAAVDAAAAGDTVAVCPGTYTEGPGGPGTNALTIAKSLTLKGAGADLVTIRPSAANGGQIADAALDLRNGTGDIAAITGTPAVPVDVAISGITFTGAGVYVEAGVVFLDARGSIARSRVTRVVTSEAAGAESTPGGYRSNFPGVGIAHLTAATTAPDAEPRLLTIDRTRVDQFNRIGVLIDGATGDTPPLTASGVAQQGLLRADQVIGRTMCIDVSQTGDCAPPPGLTTGGLFGQDGVRVTAGAAATLTSDTIAQNLVNGTGAPGRGTPTNNTNLKLGAGVRLIGAAASSIVSSNIVNNAYGVMNLELDGATANTAVPVEAEANWWGLAPTAATNPGPAVSPANNPPAPENPVNGATATDGGGTTSDAVDFFPYRNGTQSDPNTGEWPVLDAPIPVADVPPAVTLTPDQASYEPGETAHLTAEAGDDFGVKSVAFFDGATAIGSGAGPAYAASFEIPADAACTTRAVSAVARDSAGQTAGADATVVVAGCSEPEPTPTPTPTTSPTPEPGPGAVDDLRPRVNLVSPAARIPNGGATFVAEPFAPRGLASVEFLLADRQICGLSGPPYACTIVPTGGDVGAQVVRVVITDLLGGTAAAATEVVVERFRTGVTLRLPKLNGRRRIRGRLRLPSQVTRAHGCAGGSVGIRVRRRRATVVDRQLRLAPDCTFRRRSVLPRGRITVRARFNGNAVLEPATATRRIR